MRKVTIDFTKTPVEISSISLGNQGEKNATELIITPPVEMSENENIISYSVAFQIGAYEVFHSPVYDKADTITVPIEKVVSMTKVTSLQLEGFDGKETLLVRSERIDNLIFNDSVIGKEYDGKTKSELIEQIVKIKEEMLNPSYATIPLTDFIAIDTGYGITIALTRSDVIPVGTELKTIRFNFDGQLIDIKDMATIDDIPYIFNMNKVLTSTMGLPVLAVLGFWADKNAIADALVNNMISEIEVDYYI